MIERLTIDLGDRSYEVWAGTDLLLEPSAWEGLPKAEMACVVSNTRVAPLYLAAVRQGLAPHYAKVIDCVLPDGEAHKHWDGLSPVFDALLDAHADRKTVLVALGGGVVGDMTGFAAACFMRGIPFVQIPTTLLAQVDSSVGGKTAINHPKGKNMIGAFWQPVRVLADIRTLSTLPDREISAGLAEVIKYGAILDEPFLTWLEGQMPALRAGDSQTLLSAVMRSCAHKAAVVAGDERETAQRAWLNFGHTFGHAIEHELGYGQWLHGEAVGAGMVMAARLSQAQGLLSAQEVQRLERLVLSAGLPATSPPVPAQDLLNAMRHDKKALGGQIQFVLLDGLGKAQMARAPDEQVLKVMRECGAL